MVAHGASVPIVAQPLRQRLVGAGTAGLAGILGARVVIVAHRRILHAEPLVADSACAPGAGAHGAFFRHRVEHAAQLSFAQVGRARLVVVAPDRCTHAFQHDPVVRQFAQVLLGTLVIVVAPYPFFLPVLDAGILPLLALVVAP